LEFFLCFEKGFHEGVVDYDKRAHDKEIERNKITAHVAIDSVITFITGLQSNKTLKLRLNYDIDNDEPITVDTNVFRELIYNIEHAIHHMAIIKIGLNEIAPYIELPGNFGVAASTIRHNEESLVNLGQK
jgi:hypothetical protein